jgi:predicted nucleic acid-binding protein
MIVHLDTSILIEALAPSEHDLLVRAISRDDILAVSTLVLYEWHRWPRTGEQRQTFDALFTADRVVPFGADEARTAAQIYRTVRRGRTREVDIAIAACALERGAALWTRNEADFRDIPGLTLYSA